MRYYLAADAWIIDHIAQPFYLWLLDNFGIKKGTFFMVPFLVAIICDFSTANVFWLKLLLLVCSMFVIGKGNFINILQKSGKLLILNAVAEEARNNLFRLYFFPAVLFVISIKNLTAGNSLNAFSGFLVLVSLYSETVKIRDPEKREAHQISYGI